MAYYLVKAKAKGDLEELKKRLDSGEIRAMRPFGTALDESLKGARVQADETWVWEEEDYCRPPLALEREAVLDTYFTDLKVQKVEKTAGWRQIETLSSAWEK